jgi:ubiquinone biosynthesis O-methyltransferase
MLDVGCGGGLLSESLARLGASVTGIDACRENVEIARAHAQIDPRVRGNTNYRCIPAEDLEAELRNEHGDAGQFDIVCSLEVIEHVENKALFLSSLASLLRPGGLMFLSTMNRTPQSYAIAIVAAEYLTGMVPPGTHNWHKFPTPEELVKDLQPLQLETLDISGMVFTPVPFSSKLLWWVLFRSFFI